MSRKNERGSTTARLSYWDKGRGQAVLNIMKLQS